MAPTVRPSSARGHAGGRTAETGLVDVVVAKAGDEILLATAQGMAIRFSEADAYLQQARERLSAQPNRQLSAKAAYLAGRVEQHRGLFNAALAAYGNAVEQDSLDAERGFPVFHVEQGRVEAVL